MYRLSRGPLYCFRLISKSRQFDLGGRRRPTVGNRGTRAYRDIFHPSFFPQLKSGCSSTIRVSRLRIYVYRYVKSAFLFVLSGFFLPVFLFARLIRATVLCVAHKHTHTHFILSSIIHHPRRRLRARAPVCRINLRTERDLWLFINRGLLVPLRHSFPLFRCTCTHIHTHTDARATPVPVLLLCTHKHTLTSGALIYYIHIYKYTCVCDVMLLNGENHTHELHAQHLAGFRYYIISYYFPRAVTAVIQSGSRK